MPFSINVVYPFFQAINVFIRGVRMVLLQYVLLFFAFIFIV